MVLPTLTCLFAYAVLWTASSGNCSEVNNAAISLVQLPMGIKPVFHTTPLLHTRCLEPPVCSDSETEGPNWFVFTIVFEYTGYIYQSLSRYLMMQHDQVGARQGTISSIFGQKSQETCQQSLRCSFNRHIIPPYSSSFWICMAWVIPDKAN